MSDTPRDLTEQQVEQLYRERIRLCSVDELESLCHMAQKWARAKALIRVVYHSDTDEVLGKLLDLTEESNADAYMNEPVTEAEREKIARKHQRRPR